MSRPDKMRRRLLLSLGSVAATLTAAELVGCERAINVADNYEPSPDAAIAAGKTLNAVQLTTLRDVCVQTIPATDSPGAADVDVHGFIDNQLHHCHSDGQKNAVRAVLDTLNERAGGSFSAQTPADQLGLLEALEGARDGFSDDDRDQFKFTKSLIVFGYCTSEAGATQALRYLPYPGGFKGSIPADNTTRAWLLQS
ncbi:MAG: gluconate 2-dehydrogenase subunit 3 family protein [Gammaproteobacteria bacterium]